MYILVYQTPVFYPQFVQSGQIVGIKTGVWYPKMYIWSLKIEKNLLFTLKMKFLPNNLTRLYKLGIKNWSLVHQNVHLVPKNGKILLFTLKMTFLPNNLTRLYKLGDKNWSLVPQNVHLVPKNGQNFTFYTKNEVFSQQFDPIVQIGDKNWSLVPQNVHLVPKNGKILLFTLKMTFLPNNLTRLYSKKFIFSVKSTNFSIFRDQIYILGYQTPVFITNLYNRVKI